ncbi:MAG: NUDIX hydrolase [Patescibacteria group bacterium]
MQEVFCAITAVIKDDDKFLIIKKSWTNLWSIPGGKIEYGENPFNTLHREIKEEVGLAVRIIKPIGIWWFFRVIDDKQVVCFTYLCEPENEDVDISKNPGKDNITEFKWVTKDEFLQNNEYTPDHESLRELIKNL